MQSSEGNGFIGPIPSELGKLLSSTALWLSKLCFNDDLIVMVLLQRYTVNIDV